MGFGFPWPAFTVPAGTFPSWRVRYTVPGEEETGILHFSQEVNEMVRAVVDKGMDIREITELRAYTRGDGR
jgi:hypothetical protein